MIDIVCLQAHHLPQILEIEQQSQPDPWSQALFMSSLSPRYNNLVALEAGEVLGFLVSDWVCNEACLMNICVAPQHRKMGVAQALHQSLIARLLLKHTDKIWLEVRASNTQAQALYKKIGYQNIAQRKNYYAATASAPQEDAIIMELNLSKMQ
ncbi:(SSU ribosomal protein S18P)-alanine acetyltransferase [Catenovulum agarivorans DS-2]|uniref:[Ribosomal protein bS18]-alanine N-acetyltransferase n=1 Tax=Catenovulum agarivorans DS-2 TaxID=1328313 RepID=W7QRZ8_9ALTE|nr:ribosomal protein S18-alanine N-acetyltransferase [Catenovulum agarivorans]EWH08175.1 (SSU ribosomal protein S18P)-alanine acetyltransferase [Catenovulum agarivorans DS-2]